MKVSVKIKKILTALAVLLPIISLVVSFCFTINLFSATKVELAEEMIFSAEKMGMSLEKIEAFVKVFETRNLLPISGWETAGDSIIKKGLNEQNEVEYIYLFDNGTIIIKDEKGRTL